MEVKKAEHTPEPGYPSKRQFAESARVLGMAAAIGLGAFAANCEAADASAPAPEKAVTPPKQEQPVVRTHVTQAGDTFSSIAKKYFGDAARWPEIAKVNPGLDANSLKIGTAVIIPAGPRIAPPRRLGGIPPPPRPAGKMRVEPPVTKPATPAVPEKPAAPKDDKAPVAVKATVVEVKSPPPVATGGVMVAEPKAVAETKEAGK